MKRLNNLGDTIVEVMLAVAVMGLILSTSYAVATRSLLIGRQAQERGEALKVAEGQLEHLRSYVSNNLAYPALRQPTIYCLDDTLTIRSVGTLTNIPPRSAPQLAQYPPPCVVSGLYHVAIEYKRNPPPFVPGGVIDQDFFTIVVHWERSNGGAYEELKLTYKVHQ